MGGAKSSLLNRDYFQIGRDLFRQLFQATDFIIVVAQARRKRLQDDGCDAKDGTNLHGLDFLSREFTGRLLSIGLLKWNVAEPYPILLPARFFFSRVLVALIGAESESSECVNNFETPR